MLPTLMIKNLMLIILSVLVLACSSAEKERKLHQADLYFGAGTQSLMTRDYTDALTNLLKANKLNPNHSGILTNLGMAYYFKGERDLAVKTLKRALELDNENSDARINLASIYLQDGDINNAEKIYKQVLRDLTYDKQARTLYNLGTIELKRERIAEAELYFKKSVKEEGNYCPSYLQLGLIQLKRGQNNSAYKNFREATMGTCFENPVAHYYQGVALTKMKRYTEARLKFDEIDAKFNKSEYAVKARHRMMELNDIEKQNIPAEESHASRKVLESPEF